VLANALLGENVGWKEPFSVKADLELHSFGKSWSSCFQRLLERGSVKPHPVNVHMKTGLQHVLDGTEALKQKTVSGEKLVFRIVNTSYE
jgi:hypothetical protein